MEEYETEEGMTAGEPEGIGDILTASPWVMQENGAGRLQGGARAGGSDTGKAPSAVADKAGAQGPHGARPGQGEKYRGQRENMGGVTSGVWGNDGGREASRVDHESYGVGGGEGGRVAFGVAENPWGGRHRVGGGVELPQGSDTP